MMENFHPIEYRITDWTVHWLAACHLNEKIKEKKPETQKILNEMMTMCANGLKRCYEDMKKDPERFKDHWLFQAFEEMSNKKKSIDNIEEAKKLLESRGFEVLKKSNKCY